jgi:hypothetical protein
VPASSDAIVSEPNVPESTTTGSHPEAATPEEVRESVAEAPSYSSTSELALGESFEKRVPTAASATAITQSSHSDDVMEHLRSGLARLADNLVASLLDQIATVGDRASDLTAGLARTVSGAIGGLLGEARVPNPVDDPLIPPDAPAPAAPPPAIPLPVGGSYLAGGSSSGVSVSSGGAYGKLLQQFAVLDVLSLPLLQGSERPWTSREPLRPNSEPRPPNERPG